MKNNQKKKRSIIKSRIVYNAAPMNTETPIPQENSTVSVEPTVDGAWQIVVRVGFFPTEEVAANSAKHLLRGTMWEEYKNVLENFNITIH
jgi:hypothetical protein|tara:strand:+ start:460 stop:729 length:270 start_codon:yes stop_codon:yes gene_type:complete